MLKVNILLLEDLKQELDLIEIKFNQKNKSKNINDLIRQIRFEYNEVVTYYGNYSIIADDDKILELINKNIDSHSYTIELLTINIYKKNDALRRYIGEAISQQLRNNFEKLIVSPNINEWYFKAIDYTKRDKYENIDLFEGFRFKVVFLDNQVGLVVDPKSKFYTDKTLRDIYNDNRNISYKYLEKMCPIKSCDQIFNPFALCKNGNPNSFGVMDIDNFFIEDRPSDANKNLIKYYEKEGCFKGILGEKILDEKPFIHHFYSHNKEPYSYPLELIRLSPSLSDAGEESKEITRQTVLKPDERYSRFENSRKYFDSLKESSFPICLGDPLNIKSPFLKNAKFSKPYYKINSNSTDQNPFFLIKKNRYKLKPQTINLSVIVPSNIEGLEELIQEYFKDLLRWYNCKIEIQEILLKSVIFNEKINPDNFYLILKEEDSTDFGILARLLENKIKFHSISLSTIINKKFIKRENIFAPIYNKNFTPFFTIDDIFQYDRIIGVTIQYQGSYILGVLLIYNNSGILEKGYFLKQKRPKKFNEEMEKLLIANYIKKRTLVLFNGKLSKELTKAMESLEIEYIKVSETSLIRLFRASNDIISKVGVDEGSAIYFNNIWYVVPYSSTQGTQQSIKINNVNIPEDKFQKAVEICFQLTKYHIGYSDNSMKLPFPIHFGQKTIKKLRGIDKSCCIKFEYPIYI